MLIPMSKERFVERMLSDARASKLREMERKERERREHFDLTDYIMGNVNDYRIHHQGKRSPGKWRRRRR